MTVMNRFSVVGLLLGTFCVCSMGHTDEQTGIPDYRTARHLLWSKVYAGGGETIYCGREFGSNKGRGINVEHVFPMSWVTKALQCGRRKQCRESSERFNRVEGDLHNLFPSLTDINDERASMGFAMIKGEQRRYGKCDFELDAKRRLVEPREASRGEIARAMFHMAESYDLKLFRKQAKTLKRWHFEDPPSAEEERRNDVIEQLQGTRNRFIDDPESVKQLR